MSTTLSIDRALVLLCLLAALPAAAGGPDVEIERDPSADFAVLHTYAWAEGAPIGNEALQARLVAAVDRELQSRNLQRVPDAAQADLVVTSYAFSRSGLDLWSAKAKTQYGTVFSAEGRATTSKELPTNPDPKKFEKTIGKIVAAMFAEFP